MGGPVGRGVSPRRLKSKLLIEYRILALLFSLDLFLDLVGVGWDDLVVDDKIVIVLVKLWQNPGERLVNNQKQSLISQQCPILLNAQIAVVFV